MHTFEREVQKVYEKSGKSGALNAIVNKKGRRVAVWLFNTKRYNTKG